MWFPFLRPRDRFSLDELRYLTDQLQNVQIINEVNKDFVIEALRSIAELITYGDQHDPTFFEFFMDSQVMEKFVRLIKISRAATVSLQLLQTMSIMIENLKSEHAMYYMFSNEHINYLITYSFDFRNEELLSYYISFLRAISGKLNKNIISLLVKTEKDEVVSFPLYVEAIRFAFHEENMIRTAVRALTLNVYHVGDDCVNRYVVSTPHADYFSNLVSFFRKQCIHLNGLVSEILKNPGADSTSTILAAVDEIEDNLYYISDVISAGIPDVGQLITDNILHILIFPFILPSLWIKPVDEIHIGAITSLYLLCCILRIVKIKDLANAIAAALFCSPEAFVLNPEAKINGQVPGHDFFHESQQPDLNNLTEMDSGHLRVTVPNLSSSSQIHLEDIVEHADSSSHMAFRETLLSYVTSGDDMHVLGSLSVLATFLQTKELDDSILDALGILPQRKQHKKLLLQALVGEVSGEEQLFSSGDENSGQLHNYLMKLKEYYGVLCSFPVVGASPRIYKFQVLDSLVSLLCRSNISAETLWEGGWLLRQILPYSETEFSRHHLELLKDTYMNCTSTLVKEIRGIWTDLLVTVICEEWKKCKRAIEGSSPPKEPKSMFLPSQKSSPEDILVESSFAAGERMLELVKVFVLLYQLQIFCQGRTLPEQPPVHPPFDVPTNSRAINAGVDVSGPKPGTELKLADAVPCIIAFERGKERHVCFLAISRGTSGWVVLVEELPLKQQHGVVRVAAPLAGSNPIIDDKHPRWLHLRIRPSTLPRVDPAKSAVYGKAKAKALVDGRWTLAFKDEQSCSSAFAMVLEEIDVQRNVVERRLEPLLGLERGVDNLKSSLHTQQACSSSTMPSNSL